MNKIPVKLREEMSLDPKYKRCMRAVLLRDHICAPDPMSGKLIEWEHSIIFKGKQLQEKWAIIPICWLVHRGGKLDKEINQWIALNRATHQELDRISKAVDYRQVKRYLNNKYGVPANKAIEC